MAPTSPAPRGLPRAVIAAVGCHRYVAKLSGIAVGDVNWTSPVMKFGTVNK